MPACSVAVHWRDWRDFVRGHSADPTRDEWPAEDGWDDDEAVTPYPLTYERDDFVGDGQQPAAAADASQPWPPGPYPAGLSDADTKVPGGDGGGEQAPGARPPGTAGRGMAGTAASAGWTDWDLGLPEDDVQS